MTHIWVEVAAVEAAVVAEEEDLSEAVVVEPDEAEAASGVAEEAVAVLGALEVLRETEVVTTALQDQSLFQLAPSMVQGHAEVVIMALVAAEEVAAALVAAL